MSFESLEQIKLEENEIRDNMYKSEYLEHAMNTDPYYNLIEIKEDIWNWICVSILQIKGDDSLYFPESRLQLRKRVTRSWDDIVKLAKDNHIEEHFGENAENVYIAGGRALATLLTVQCNDIDYFTTKEIKPWEIKSKSKNYTVTPHVINFDEKKQLIKRLYKMPHEIVHSFDIDCCSVLINKDGNIYGSKRFIYSLIKGCNTVDFNYFSPSYEWRLIKYTNRGFSVSVPYVTNCKDPESLYSRIEKGVCLPDSIWKFADIDDILDGSALRSLLMNAKGLQKLLIASAVATPDGSSESHNRLNKISTKQLSDYEVPIGATDAISGKIRIPTTSDTDKFYYYLNGSIGYDDSGAQVSYKGLLTLSDQGHNLSREFSTNLTNKILNIFNSPYRKVNPGEQTTSTFHKIVLEDPNQWYALEKPKLFEDSLYTLLYFKSVSRPPFLYDEKAAWFDPEAINLFVYHFARLVLNNRAYDKFNNLEITTFKIAFGDIRPKSIIYHPSKEEFIIPRGDSRGILETLLFIGSKYTIFSERELEILNSLYIRTREGAIPKIELGRSNSW